MRRVTGMQAIAELDLLDRTLDELARLPRKLATAVAPALNRELQRQFRDGVDPYGRPWAPLAEATLAKGRTPPPLTDSGQLRKGARVTQPRANYAGLRMVLGSRYGFFHQVGFRNARTGRMVKPRRMLPQYGMPRTWRALLDSHARLLARIATGGR